MPECFCACYGTKVVAIVDCYEIKIETPSHLVAKLATWSQYKHANTAKVFTAMCPQEVTSFVSCPWGGRVSDKHLTVNCGFLAKLLPGDIVLADHGFDNEEDVARMQATLQIPAFTRGCAQLSPQDLEKTRQLTNVRIHIEGKIGAAWQRFSILMSCIPIDYVKPKMDGERATIDKIIVICSALNNLCKSVVPTYTHVQQSYFKHAHLQQHNFHHVHELILTKLYKLSFFKLKPTVCTVPLTGTWWVL